MRRTPPPGRQAPLQRDSRREWSRHVLGRGCPATRASQGRPIAVASRHDESTLSALATTSWATVVFSTWQPSGQPRGGGFCIVAAAPAASQRDGATGRLCSGSRPIGGRRSCSAADERRSRGCRRCRFGARLGGRRLPSGRGGRARQGRGRPGSGARTCRPSSAHIGTRLVRSGERARSRHRPPVGGTRPVPRRAVPCGETAASVWRSVLRAAAC